MYQYYLPGETLEEAAARSGQSYEASSSMMVCRRFVPDLLETFHLNMQARHRLRVVAFLGVC